MSGEPWWQTAEDGGKYEPRSWCAFCNGRHPGSLKSWTRRSNGRLADCKQTRGIVYRPLNTFVPVWPSPVLSPSPFEPPQFYAVSSGSINVNINILHFGVDSASIKLCLYRWWCSKSCLVWAFIQLISKLFVCMNIIVRQSIMKDRINTDQRRSGPKRNVINMILLLEPDESSVSFKRLRRSSCVTKAALETSHESVWWNRPSKLLERTGITHVLT